MEPLDLVLWFCAATIWGSAFLFMAWSVDGFSALETLLLRQGIGGFCLLLASIFGKGRKQNYYHSLPLAPYHHHHGDPP